MQKVKITNNTARAAVKSDRRYATGKATAKGRQTTLARRQVRAVKYGRTLAMRHVPGLQ